MGKKKRNLPSPEKMAEAVRREQEILETGRLVSLRPSVVHKSKKSYTRKWKLNNED